MKRLPTCYHLFMLLLALCAATATQAQPTTNRGRVVINEYMPWPSNGCGATSEFIELLNFGPGPIDIGCYILTEGDFSITIPPNTILKPGEFYVIAGQNTIPFPCANIDSSITVDLNWNTCGCTSAPIPTTGDGLFTDGGSASEQLVLLDPAMNIVDAVIRALPAEPSSLITTSSVAGCAPLSFDLDLMTINYEVLGMSAGRGNSFARLIDGDCGWVKDPQQSGNATNNTPGDASEISYEMDIVDAQQCGTVYGSVEIYVKHHDYAVIFPMNYTISFDSDNDGDFDFNDSYTYGTDNSPPSISISGLFMGRYRVTVASVSGCFLHTLEFSILNCFGALPVSLEYFRSVQKGTYHRLDWKVTDQDEVEKMIIQKSDNGFSFADEAVIDKTPGNYTGEYSYTLPAVRARYYRLKVKTKSGGSVYSSVIGTGLPKNVSVPKIWPSPASNIASISIDSDKPQSAGFQIYNSMGSLVQKGNWQLERGKNVFDLKVADLLPGVYQIVIVKNDAPAPVRFIKQ